MKFETSHDLQSWGRVGRYAHHVARPHSLGQVRSWNRASLDTRLAVGNRRSYSDVCLAHGGQLIDMTSLDRFHSFDSKTGILTADAGITVGEVLKTFVPRGYFVPVTPGTQFVTLGGAVANDVHGKNHLRAGTFGCHIEGLTIERSDQGTLSIGPQQRSDLFAATVGGLGLTGIISEVRLRLQPIQSSSLTVIKRVAGDLDELSAALGTDGEFEHRVAWIDCTATGQQLGRGLVSLGTWTDDKRLEIGPRRVRSVPSDRFGGLLTPYTLRLFNRLYYRAGQRGADLQLMHYEQFLYPLDALRNWNRLYGPSGFYQYQCVIPDAAGLEPIRDLLKRISASGEGSLLAVLKRFGKRSSPGLLSFPEAGLTLALDFRNRGVATLNLFAKLDEIVKAAGGRLYAAKDARIPGTLFHSNDRLAEFARHIDPRCQSDFWKRLN